MFDVLNAREQGMILPERNSFKREDVMETSSRLSQTDSRNPSSPEKNIRASMSHDREHHHRATPETPHASHQVSKGSPSLKSDGPLRIALLLSNPKSLQALSHLEHIPGIEIVGVADQPVPDQEPDQKQERPYPFGTPSTLLINQTSPHVLLDFTGDPHTQPLGEQYPLADTEIPGPYTASLLEKMVEHKNGLDQQMAQIEKLANVGTLASGILHDINNPLYVILGFSENLLEEKISGTVRDQALEILQATKRIITMCEDLNLYARQRTPKECTMVDLTAQLEEAMKVARFSVGLENILVVRAYSAHPMILARPEEIIQIFVNLIINALQAMDGRGTLTLEAVCTDLVATITIKDTGPGIPQEYMRKIFEPFFTTKPPGKGTGLGLHSVRSLVHQCGGQILIKSMVGEGTTFHLEFPLAPDSTPSPNA
jgi:two-component system NtrC family sensor kinase